MFQVSYKNQRKFRPLIGRDMAEKIPLIALLGIDQIFVMKTTTVIKLFLFAVIFSFSSGAILAAESPKGGGTQQTVQEKKIIKEPKNILKEPKPAENNEINYTLLLNLLGIAVSASLIIWQIGRQHKSNFELQRENHREKLKLEIYSEYRKKISESLDKVGSAGNNARTILTHFNIFVSQVSKGIPPLPIHEREPVFREIHFAAINSITSLIFLLEEYEIINPDLEIFRTAFSCASRTMTDTFFPFQQVLLDFLPYDVPLQDQEKVGTDVVIPKVPSKNDLEKITEVTQPYIDAAMDATCYISDLAHEAQNIFLGSLFAHRLSPRKPIDPKHVVISAAPQEVSKLKKYFFEETEWGKNAKKVEEEVRQQLKKEQNP